MSEEEMRGAPLAFVADLIFASKVRGAAQALGVEAEVVQSAEAAMQRARAARPRVVLIDLEARRGAGVDLLRRLREDPDTAGLTVVAFASHQNTGAIAAAREAGADRVLARSAFVRELPGLLRGDAG